MPAFVKVAGVSDVPPGTVKEVEANGKLIALANVEGQFYALDNVCLHQGGPVGQGVLEGHQVECPWHGWQYDVKSGQCVFNPVAQLATYEVKVDGGDVLVAI